MNIIILYNHENFLFSQNSSGVGLEVELAPATGQTRVRFPDAAFPLTFYNSCLFQYSDILLF